jgi:hypothetical protein
MTARKRPVPGVTTSKRKGRPPEARPRPERDPAVAINLGALRGQSGLALGDRVRIDGSGLNGGETGVIERFTGTAIPTAVVRMESGHVRHVRTVDLAPLERH